ncbi:DNA (cytosine-5-)-methyltransferase [Geitlerinema sp. CS-897]|nr:DNA (cytosine-5-)-methyltransferase [Geitlerinema sp. CS-897]
MSTYRGWNLSEAEREKYRQISKASSQAKAKAMRGQGVAPVHEINQPKLNPENLMPQLPKNGLRSLSLFSGGGGLDLGFDRAGFQHTASYEVLEDAGKTLKRNRSNWTVFSGDAGDVRNVDWTPYRGEVDVIHGGPPCQPFSIAGRQEGKQDNRDMFPEFVRAILELSPRAFVAENVSALSSKKFNDYVFHEIQKPLLNRYNVLKIVLYAPDFGIPQSRKRVFFIGFQEKRYFQKFVKPQPLYDWQHLNSKKNNLQRDRNSLQLNLFEGETSVLKTCMGVREALGLPDIGFDALAPTLRSGLTGPRHTTSILNSSSAQTLWRKLQIWPNGVAETRENARLFVAKNKHFRLSVPDCAILQGFPESWKFCGAVYMALGQIGNAVPPPLGYHVARAIERALS